MKIVVLSFKIRKIPRTFVYYHAFSLKLDEIRILLTEPQNRARLARPCATEVLSIFDEFIVW